MAHEVEVKEPPLRGKQAALIEGVTDHPSVLAFMEALPPGLSREVAMGASLWLSGFSKRKAAQIAGCDSRRITRVIEELPDDMRRAELRTSIAPLAAQVSREAMRQTYEKLTDPEAEEASLMQLATVGGIYADKLVNLARVDGAQQDTGDALGQILDRIRSGGEVTLSVKTPETMDTTASQEDPSPQKEGVETPHRLRLTPRKGPPSDLIEEADQDSDDGLNAE